MRPGNLVQPTRCTTIDMSQTSLPTSSITGRAPIMLSVTTKLPLSRLIQCNKECRVPIKTMASTTAGVSSKARFHFPPLQRTAWINSTCKACTRPRLPVASVVVIIHSAVKGGHSLSKTQDVCQRMQSQRCQGRLPWKPTQSRNAAITRSLIHASTQPEAGGSTSRGLGPNTQRRRMQHPKAEGTTRKALSFYILFVAFCLLFSASLLLCFSLFCLLFSFFLFVLGCFLLD